MSNFVRKYGMTAGEMTVRNGAQAAALMARMRDDDARKCAPGRCITDPQDFTRTSVEAPEWQRI